MKNITVFGLFALLTALVVTLGGALGDQNGMLLAFLMACGSFVYWKRSSMVLRLHGAQIIEPGQAPGLCELVDRLRQRAGLPMPTVAVAPHAHRIPMNAPPAAAPLAQVNPLAAYGGGIAKLFRTHPPTEERVAAHEELADRSSRSNAAARP